MQANILLYLISSFALYVEKKLTCVLVVYLRIVFSFFIDIFFYSDLKNAIGF